MKISRRFFLLHSGAAALTASIVLPVNRIYGQIVNTEPLFPIPPESEGDPLNYLRHEHFEAFINTVFEFEPDNGRAFNLKLVLVENLQLPANDKQGFQGESYSLVFEGSKKLKIHQGVYRVNHDTLGRFSLLIVPVGLVGNRFEAIINKINA